MAQVFTFPKNRQRLPPGLGDVAADAMSFSPVSTNAQGPTVRALQNFLVAVHAAQPAVNGKPFATGVYDDATITAVTLLQRMLGVTADGGFNQKTVDAIKADVQKTTQSILLKAAGLTGQAGGGQGPLAQQPADTTAENIFAWLQAIGAVPASEEYTGAGQQNMALNEVIRSLAAKWGLKPAPDGYPFPAGHAGRGAFFTQLRAAAVARGWGSGQSPGSSSSGIPWLLIGGVTAAGLGLAWYFSRKPQGMAGVDASDIGSDVLPAPRRKPAKKARKAKKA